MFARRLLLALACVWFSCLLQLTSAADDINFNRDIRPILSENCFYCHGQDGNKREADLRLDLRDSALAAQAIVPGDAKASALVQRMHSVDPETQMPPPKSNRRLTQAQKQLLERWVNAGAPYLDHWAFTTPKRPNTPEVKQTESARTAIDRFVQSKLDPMGLTLAPEAERATLIKRLSIDLLGVPPTPEQVQGFVGDQRPDAYLRLVDRWLASPRYGERMALPWLDAARYADSNGFQQDGDTWQWLWRDWVVRALNSDLPFDQFTIWQLAGDLLPSATTDQKIASGFNRNHLLNGEGGAIAEEQRFVNLFDRIDTTSTNWLGLTMACAQCHDHKYDPLTMKDYYSLLDAFNRVPETGTPQRFSSRIRVAPPVLELPTPENAAHIKALEDKIQALDSAAKSQVEAAWAGWMAAITGDLTADAFKNLSDRTKELLRKAEADRSADDKQELESLLRKYFDDKVRSGLSAKLPDFAKQEALRKELADYKADQIPRVMIMSDDKPRESAILERGEYLKPTTKVSFAPPAFLPPLPLGAPANRLGFAQWLVAPNHPLTSRVQVNRMWQHFFGMGIVKTTEDFGVQSEYPLHGELLDWLAVEFVQRDWSSKALHRQIVQSATYCQSSRVTAELRALDSDNKLLARASRFRMPSLLLRDWALSVSGLMDRQLGGVPVYPYQPDAVWEALAITKERDFTYPASSGTNLYRRSLYTFWRRTVGPANMFDASNRQTCRVRVGTTSTPLHALTTLNDPTWGEAARVLAEQVMQTASTNEARLRMAAERVLCRTISDAELEMLVRALSKQREIYASDEAACQAVLNVGQAKRDTSLPVLEHAALSQVCLALLNLDEALTRE
ncbi:MAG: PSD1 domain-containing protein [Pirellulaceae bacterium]|nr:PSD1 domain-containing protein [Pirellulaceae bacterium]